MFFFIPGPGMLKTSRSSFNKSSFKLKKKEKKPHHNISLQVCLYCSCHCQRGGEFLRFLPSGQVQIYGRFSWLQGLHWILPQSHPASAFAAPEALGSFWAVGSCLPRREFHTRVAHWRSNNLLTFSPVFVLEGVLLLFQRSQLEAAFSRQIRCGGERRLGFFNHVLPWSLQ